MEAAMYVWFCMLMDELDFVNIDDNDNIRKTFWCSVPEIVHQSKLPNPF